jgi:hypothetical protein
MPDSTVVVPLSDHKLGDPWPGIPSIGPIVINDATPDGLLTRIRVQFRQGGHVFTLDSDESEDRDSPITITNAATWLALIPPVQNFVTRSGEWDFDIQYFKAGSKFRTLHMGTLTVHPNITKP